MKKRKIIFVFLVSLVGILLVWGCRKKSPEGPTDIRITNISDYVFDTLYMDTSFGNHLYGILLPDDTTEYKRYEKAYREAYIRLYINQVKYEFIPSDNTYWEFLGRDKYTFSLDADTTNHSLSIEITEHLPF